MKSLSSFELSHSIHDNARNLVRYENGQMTDVEADHLFATLLNTGWIDRLQERHQRAASVLMNSGRVVRDQSGHFVANVSQAA
ncbi:MAG: hypothetical protein ACI80V_003829 [Rhodothermales bacterium]|jgi:hypothetical protein